jgi:hypothetical protein
VPFHRGTHLADITLPFDNAMTWDECPDADFDYFNIYRFEEGLPGTETLVHSTSGENWTDPISDGYKYRYRISATDFNGNESDKSGADGVTGAGDQRVPQETALYQNIPNPFNPSTTIRYSVSEAGHVSLKVYDARGALVRTLVDKEMASGNEQVMWDGKDARGHQVSTGVYFYRLEASGKVYTRKMMLLK